MGYHPRIEVDNVATFHTTRSRNSELWFINNPKLENAILGYAAKYSKRYQVKLYALAIEGNHVQFPALFSDSNRASFMRDLNSCIARAIPRYCSTYPGGSLWARRYSAEYIPDPEDIEKQFFYTVLQPVQDRLVDHIEEYPGYNCFYDAIHGVTRVFQLVNWTAYYQAKRWGAKVKPSDFLEEYTLKYQRLPGYEDFTEEQYVKLMKKKLEVYRQGVIEERGNKPALGRAALLAIKPGSRPQKTKKSERSDVRPRILGQDSKRRAAYDAWYLEVYFDFKEASKRFRSGELNVPFPSGTYRPPSFTVKLHLDQLSVIMAAGL